MGQVLCTECGCDITKQGRHYPFGVCQACYKYFREGGELYDIPPKGEVHYDSRGFPICHICGRSFKKLGAHIYNKHGITRREYCKQFGLDLDRGLCSAELREHLREKNAENFSVVVEENLKLKGTPTRFTKGSKGRTRDKCSLQTINRLKQNIFKQ